MLATKVPIDHSSPITIQQALEGLEVLGVLDPKHGYLDTMLGGYVALELQVLGESYLNYGTHAIKLPYCLIHRLDDVSRCS